VKTRPPRDIKRYAIPAPIIWIAVTVVVAAVTFMALVFLLFPVSSLMDKLNWGPNTYHMGTFLFVESIVHLVVIFIGGWIVWAHDSNVVGARGPWSEHVFRNPAGLGMIIGAIGGIWLLALLWLLSSRWP